jgi:hypothetical protein
MPVMFAATIPARNCQRTYARSSGPELQNQRKAHSLSRALHLFYRDGQTYWYEVPTGLEVGISECGTKTESHIPRMPFLGTWRLYPRILMSRILSHFRLME